MRYMNAQKVLPDYLVEQLQEYIQGEYLYIPVNTNQHKTWGEHSGYKNEIEKRNEKIKLEFFAGNCMEDLADKYFLSIYSIRKIIYKK